MISLKEKLENLLKKEKEFLDENRNIDYIKIKDLADKIDNRLIELLITNNEVKKKFFSKIKDVYVFNINHFKFFLDESKVNNSYTQYKNRIGLSDGKEFIQDKNNVVLDFPFKDCVLEGGQSTEEGVDTYFEYDETVTKAQEKQGLKANTYNQKTAKRNEIFFNQILAHDEIDRLYDRKAFVNWARFNKNTKKDGEEVKEIKRDKTGLIKENLVIKGNNLLALHSLRSEFAGKIKLIYIDPPYNTGNDGFNYNDNFNHSTWLTFIKNRLEIAKELLKDDGVIFVQCDDNEQAYLKVLMDELFNKSNFVENFMWFHGKGKKDKNTRTLQEYAICYAKNIEKLESWNITKKANYSFSNPDNDPRGDWFSGSISFSEERSNIHHENYFTIKSPSGIEWTRQWQCSEEEMNEYLENNKIYFGNSPKYENVPRLKIFPDDEDEIIPPNIFDNHGTTRSAKKELKDLGYNFDDFDTPKTEKLIKAIIELATKKNDIVLDYYLGSGTTCAVAHKIDRQYIGIEQMDYVETIAVDRLKKVINGEQGGVSKFVDWQGGKDFIYCEIAKWNEQAKEEIQKTKDLSALVKLFDVLYKKYFLNYNVKIKDFKEKIIKEKNFKKLTLDQQKKMFLSMLDLNQMYVNESEMSDKKYEISAKDQELTKAFYSKK